MKKYIKKGRTAHSFGFFGKTHNIHKYIQL